MWHRLNNVFISLATHRTLSPDLRVRRQVSRWLCQRPDLSPDRWFETFYQSQGIAYPIVLFVYRQLAAYSGLPIGRLQPGDRLNEDLHWIDLCWFDWHLTLCDDFHSSFGVDISDCFDSARLATIGDLVRFLDRQWSYRQG